MKVTILSVLGTLVFIGGFVWLCMVNAVVGGSLFALFCASIFAVAMIKSRNSAGEVDEFKLKYGEDVYGWNGYIPDVTVDSLNELAEIITNAQATDCTDMNFAWDSSADITMASFIDALHDLGYGFYYEETPFRFAEDINELCARLGYDARISEEDILANEDEYTKRRRQDGISTHMHDVGMVAKALERQSYTVIELGMDMDGPYFIVPLDRVKELQ